MDDQKRIILYKFILGFIFIFIIIFVLNIFITKGIFPNNRGVTESRLQNVISEKTERIKQLESRIATLEKNKPTNSKVIKPNYLVIIDLYSSKIQFKQLNTANQRMISKDINDFLQLLNIYTQKTKPSKNKLKELQDILKLYYYKVSGLDKNTNARLKDGIDRVQNYL